MATHVPFFFPLQNLNMSCLAQDKQYHFTSIILNKSIKHIEGRTKKKQSYTDSTKEVTMMQEHSSFSFFVVLI